MCSNKILCFDDKFKISLTLFDLNLPLRNDSFCRLTPKKEQFMALPWTMKIDTNDSEKIINDLDG